MFENAKLTNAPSAGLCTLVAAERALQQPKHQTRNAVIRGPSLTYFRFADDIYYVYILRLLVESHLISNKLWCDLAITIIQSMHLEIRSYGRVSQTHSFHGKGGGGEITPRAHYCPLLRHLDEQPKFLPCLSWICFLHGIVLVLTSYDCASWRHNVSKWHNFFEKNEN